MTADHLALLLHWLAAGTEAQRRHAEWRLAQPEQIPAPDVPVSLPPIAYAPNPCGGCGA
jgi:hypothetical protein